MPFPVKPKQFTSWSNSRWNDYNQCPARAKYKHLDKLPEPKSPQMDRGIFIAKQEEDYFLGKVRSIPPDIHKDLHPEFRRIKKKGKKNLLVEENWGFDRNWQPVDYFDWNNCWLRVKVDVGYTDAGGRVIHLYDNKTGGIDKSTGGLRLEDREKYEEQLDLYRAAAVARFPNAEEFHTKLIYTDIGITFPPEAMVSSAAEALKSQKAWSKKVVPMFNDKRFLPRPGFYCRWCHFSKSKGGPCRF